MTAPTLVTSGATAWNTTTTPKSTSSLSVQTGDVIVFYAVAEGNSVSWGTPTGGSLTYSLQQNINLASYCAINVWTAIATSTTSVTVQVANSGSAIRWGVGWYVYRGSAGVGNSNKANNSTGDPSVSVTASGANSAMVAVNADWNAGATTGKTWATINSITPSAGNGLEKVATQDASHYTIYSAYWDDCGATGSKSPGMTAPSGQQWALIAVEILGSSSSDATVTAAAITATATVPDGTVSAGSTVTPTAISAVASVPDPVVSAGGATVTAEPITATTTVPAGDLSTGSTVSPAAITAATTVPAATVSASEGATVTASPITATTSVPTPTISGNVPVVDPDFPWVLRAAPGYQVLDTIPSSAWEDVTDRVVGAITRRVGRERPGEDAPATQLTFTLNIDDGLVMPELVTSEWWPNVVLGLPFQFWRCDSTGTPVLLSTVGADSYKVHWPTGLDDHATVTIVASGPLRWMDQGQHVDLTAQAGAALADTPLAYWPCTDADGATTAASAVAGGQPMTRTTTDVRFGQITGPDGTTKYPSMVTSGRLVGQIPTTAVTTVWAFELIGYVVQPSADWFTVAYLSTTSSSVPAWRLRWDSPSGPLTLRSIDDDDVETVVVTASVAVGSWKRIAAQAVQNSGNVDCSLYVDGVSVGTGTATSATTGRPTSIAVGDYDGAGSGFQSAGEVAVYDHVIDYADRYEAQQGYDGEMAHVRAARVAAQLGVPFDCDATTSMLMGPQKDETAVASIKACGDSDGGILTDDRPDPGLRYVATSEMTNQAPAITLNAREDEHLQLPFSATRDDAQAATDVTITRDGGSSRRVSVDAPRVYVDSDTLSLYTDELANAVASWRAHHGAQTDLRYDAIVWDCAAVPELLDTTLALRCGNRIVVEDLPRPHPQADVSLILQGWTEVHDLEVFRFEAKVAPARLFEVMTIGSDDPGDWDDTTARIDSDTSTIGGSGGTTSSTSLVVESDYGWSTTAVPYDWDLLGERVRVTAMSTYSGGQQTATVTRAINGISKAVPIDTPVRLWRPPVIGL